MCWHWLSLARFKQTLQLQESPWNVGALGTVCKLVLKSTKGQLDMQITSRTSTEEERQATLSDIKHCCDPKGFYRKELVKLMGSPL